MKEAPEYQELKRLIGDVLLFTYSSNLFSASSKAESTEKAPANWNQLPDLELLNLKDVTTVVVTKKKVQELYKGPIKSLYEALGPSPELYKHFSELLRLLQDLNKTFAQINSSRVYSASLQTKVTSRFLKLWQWITKQEQDCKVKPEQQFSSLRAAVEKLETNAQEIADLILSKKGAEASHLGSKVERSHLKRKAQPKVPSDEKLKKRQVVVESEVELSLSDDDDFEQLPLSKLRRLCDRK